MDIFSEKTVLTVSRLTALMRDTLEENFERVWVRGEVSNVSQPSSGHLYFSLKDSGAQLRCVVFRGAARNLKFLLQDGMELIVRGRVSIYDQRGECQLVCEYLEPSGLGALQAAFMQLKERLAREGLFEEKRKRSLPPFPRKIGVITSATGAAVHDILNVLERRFASLDVLIYPVRVQGEGAGSEIARAIEDMNRLKLADVLIVGRGGGSLEDLQAFNEEILARAVYNSRIPIISAVGHETDWTICDFAADLRAPTPSAAAELVVASAEELRGILENLSHRLRLSVQNHLSVLATKISSLTRLLSDPSSTLGHLSQRVDDLSARLDFATHTILHRLCENSQQLEQSLLRYSPASGVEKMRQSLTLLLSKAERLTLLHLETAQREFGDNSARLGVLSPLATLSRGYSITTRLDNGAVIRDVALITTGDRVRITLARGKALCRVDKLESSEA